MKVLHINQCGSVTIDIVNGLRNLGIEAEIFQPTIGTYRTTPSRRFLLPLIRNWEAIKLHRLVRQQQYDVIHVHYASIAYMTIITGLPYFLHCHGSDLRRDLSRPLIGDITRKAIRKAIKVFYVTPDLKSYLDLLRSDAIFLPNPVDLKKFKPSSSIEQFIPRILCISKMESFKGVDRMIQIIERLWKIRPQIEVAIFNFGNSRIADAFIEKHHGEPRLILLPRIPHNKMPELIRSYLIIIGQQSLEIGALGLSELEAMACGKPVVCTFNCPNAYPEPPPIINSNDLEDAVDNIIHLLDDPSLCIRIGKEARNWVSKYHNIQKVIETLVDSYTEYIKTKA